MFLARLSWISSEQDARALRSSTSYRILIARAPTFHPPPTAPPRQQTPQVAGAQAACARSAPTHPRQSNLASKMQRGYPAPAYHRRAAATTRSLEPPPALEAVPRWEAAPLRFLPPRLSGLKPSELVVLCHYQISEAAGEGGRLVRHRVCRPEVARVHSAGSSVWAVTPVVAR